ncbi:MAG: hypothetical protein LUG52_09315 [Clostridia bacterium]|nr:hypothetical protein [Clostridia bacterium]
MTEYEKLAAAEKYAHTIEIVETATGKAGVANTTKNGVAVFYGANDGSDDKMVTAEEFSENFRITAILK